MEGGKCARVVAGATTGNKSGRQQEIGGAATSSG